MINPAHFTPRQDLGKTDECTKATDEELATPRARLGISDWWTHWIAKTMMMHTGKNMVNLRGCVDNTSYQDYRRFFSDRRVLFKKKSLVNWILGKVKRKLKNFWILKKSAKTDFFRCHIRLLSCKSLKLYSRWRFFFKNVSHESEMTNCVHPTSLAPSLKCSLSRKFKKRKSMVTFTLEFQEL